MALALALSVLLAGCLPISAAAPKPPTFIDPSGTSEEDPEHEKGRGKCGEDIPGDRRRGQGNVREAKVTTAAGKRITYRATVWQPLCQ
jgi:hypothetical protein